MRILTTAALIGAALPVPAAAAQQERPRLAARYVDAAPVIDGRLDDAAWHGADVASGFVQLRPDAGTPASQATEARVVYDGAALYVAMRMYDRTDAIAAELRRRDDLGGYSDWVHVMLGSYGDERTAFRFSVNPRGVQADAFLYDDVRSDAGWDAVWQVATRVDSLGWTAEFRIPLSQLRYAPPGADAGEYAWDLNFQRDVARLDEASSWSPIPANAGRTVSLFGRLTGLEQLRQARRLEMVPYSLARLRNAPVQPGDPFRSRYAPGAEAGADVRFGLTSNLTLTATVNPDFGQVEADPSEVNLTAFETFLPERRPFFAEGLDVFDFRIIPRGAGSEQLLYSRRIGRPPQRGVGSPPGGYHDAPEASRILGAAKITGKTAGGWTVGLLAAVTAEEEARFQDSTGARWEEPVEPLTGLVAARLVRNFQGGRSAIGGIATALDRRIDDTGLDFLRSSAYVAGVDARHRFGDGRYEGTLYVAGSQVQGSPASVLRTQLSSARYFQRPDAAHLSVDSAATSVAGWGTMATLSTVGGRTGWWLGASNRSPGFEVNDAGYQLGADERWIALVLSHNEQQAGRRFRRYGGSLLAVPIWTTAWERVATWIELTANGELRSFHGGDTGLSIALPAYDVKSLRGGPAMRTPLAASGYLNVNTDRRRALAANAGASFSREEDTGSRSAGLNAGLSYRASSRLTLSASPSYHAGSVSAQWVRAVALGDSAAYLFGRMEQQTASLTTRLSFTASPRLSLQFYAQPYLSAADYEDWMLVADPRAPRHRDRFAPIPADGVTRDEGTGRYQADVDLDGSTDFTFANPDFRFREVRSTTVLRWEFRPGSALFAVWSHGRNELLPDGRLEVIRDARGLFRAAPTHVLLLKLTYWLQL
jgi:hypothetical protein